MHNSPCLVSACLLGLCTRYDGRAKTDHQCLAAITGTICIPVCPEQLGGLPTPREAADIVGGDGTSVLAGTAGVLTKSGIDLTAEFIRGAEQVLQIATSQNVRRAFLKARSPSCAITGKIGVTAALLRSAGIALTEF
ncbi:DUF523 domain-containing protein [Desulfopila sp. IMCC35006]|uniref:DUF523 domain-containing protein n=1 Tax=Desulfopila sp. IMCC35006 TaxID=2569542 RepID=UPI0010AD0451|nr:DUF523 domain-containing protein [Desulfopila sp. IMCC35006]TKB23808.1 DUF523 domain-containing protein [Desulfopila sp. IMCC35006]